MILYHATYFEYLPSILDRGLIPGLHRSYAGSDTAGLVFFSYDEEHAISYAEAADEVSDAVYNTGIVVLEIDSAFLDGALYTEDPNEQDDGAQKLNIAYAGSVPVSAIVRWTSLD